VESCVTDVTDKALTLPLTSGPGRAIFTPRFGSRFGGIAKAAKSIMTMLFQLPPVRPDFGPVRRSILMRWAAWVIGALLLPGSFCAVGTHPLGCSGSPNDLSSQSTLKGAFQGLASPVAAGVDSFPSDSSGPTLVLNYGRGESPGNPVADFMYFVALISPEPVSITQSPDNTQRARMISATRRSTGNSFVVTCEFEFAGQGSLRNVFDHTEKIHQHERKLKEGGVLDHQLGSINVDGSGTIGIEVEGTTSAGIPNVTEVRFRFNGRGRQSPVSIDLHDIRYVAGAFRDLNETLARVNTLTFRKQPGPTKMEISVASVRRKEAGDSRWETVVGKVKATAVNLVMEPIEVDPAGHEAMLKFGLALVSQAPAFTFPRARHLKR
jgi:hypothetical protein